MIIDFKTKRETVEGQTGLLTDAEENELIKQIQADFDRYEKEKAERITFWSKRIFNSCRTAKKGFDGTYKVSGINGLIIETYFDAYKAGYTAALIEAISSLLNNTEEPQ